MTVHKSTIDCVFHTLYVHYTLVGKLFHYLCYRALGECFTVDGAFYLVY